MKSLGGGDKGRLAESAGLHAARRPLRPEPADRSLVVGIDSMEVLEQDLGIARGFKPMPKAEMQKLLAKVRPEAADGRHERFKSTQFFDGPYHQDSTGSRWRRLKGGGEWWLWLRNRKPGGERMDPRLRFRSLSYRAPSDPVLCRRNSLIVLDPAHHTRMALTLVSNDGDVLRLQAAGQIRHAHIQRNRILRLYRDHGYGRKVLLNLEQVRFIDSAGIGWLLSIHKRFERAGGKLVLYNVPESIQLTLKVLQLDTGLNIAETEADAAELAK